MPEDVPIETPPKPHSPEPWVLDRNDERMILDSERRLVAVTTMREDAVRLLSAVNAVRGLALEGLATRSIFECLQALYELSRYHRDAKFRESVDKDGGLGRMLDRCDSAWGAFGEERFQS